MGQGFFRRWFGAEAVPEGALASIHGGAVGPSLLDEEPLLLTDRLPMPRPQIELEFHLIRAGTTETSVSAEYLLKMHNAGEVPATDIRLDLRIFGMDARIDPAIAAAFSGRVERPVISPFQMVAGEGCEIDGSAAMGRDVMPVMTIEGVDFFVPVLTADARYRWADGQGQTAASVAVGLVFPGAARLTPFRRHAPPRLFENVGSVAYHQARRV